jgi:hypothetical protein
MSYMSTELGRAGGNKICSGIPVLEIDRRQVVLLFKDIYQPRRQPSVRICGTEYNISTVSCAIITLSTFT